MLQLRSTFGSNSLLRFISSLRLHFKWFTFKRSRYHSAEWKTVFHDKNFVFLSFAEKVYTNSRNIDGDLIMMEILDTARQVGDWITNSYLIIYEDCLKCVGCELEPFLQWFRINILFHCLVIITYKGDCLHNIALFWLLPMCN